MECVRYSGQDLKEICEIESHSFSDPWSEQTFSMIADTENCLFLVLKENKRVIGYTLVSSVADEAEVLNVAIHKDFRRRGLARRLLEEAFATVDNAGVKKVYLEVRESNCAARSLYRSLGFESCAIRRSYYRNPTENAVIMCKSTEL